MLDWIFEGIVTWISSMVSQLMDAVSGLFLDALGTDMTAMEEYFPFVSKAFDVTHLISGAALGVDMWAVEIVLELWDEYSDITWEVRCLEGRSRTDGSGTHKNGIGNCCRSVMSQITQEILNDVNISIGISCF